jgi:hypothetical protein
MIRFVYGCWRNTCTTQCALEKMRQNAYILRLNLLFNLHDIGPEKGPLCVCTSPLASTLCGCPPNRRSDGLGPSGLGAQWGSSSTVHTSSGPNLFKTRF